MQYNISNCNGLSLIEMIISMVIISVALAGTMLAFKTSVGSSSNPMILQQALSIGKSYLEEILAKEFPTIVPCPTPPAGGRSTYENVCDFNNLIDNGAKNQFDQALVGLENYTVQVTIDTTTAQLGSLVSGSQVIRVDVNVSHAEISTVPLSGYRTTY